MHKVTIYTDGACSPNPGTGGYAALLLWEDRSKTITGAEENTTNNRMELSAVIEALKDLKEAHEVILYTDSQYVKGGITQWIKTWVYNGWYTIAGKPVKNRDLWEALFDETQRHIINWQWVKGHDKNEYNIKVDALAVQARLGMW